MEKADEDHEARPDAGPTAVPVPEDVTDEGIVGYGEPVIEGRARTVAEAVRDLEREYLIGQDPRRIEHHWQTMYRGTFYRGGPILTSAIIGIEQAMWDIPGKSLGVPIYQLLGGAVRAKIRVYDHVDGDTRKEAAASVSTAADQGFTAVKRTFTGPFQIVDRPSTLVRAREIFAAMREAVGDDVDIAPDGHRWLSPAQAIRIAHEIEPYRPMFFEEPCLTQNVDTIVTIARSTTNPIATDERLFTRWDFREVVEKQAASILQPDLCHAGGIFECRKIAAMAETYFAAVAPHNPLGPVSLAACLQLDACTRNFLAQEQTTLGEGMLKEPFQMVDWYIPLPPKPGLGIELDEEALRDRAGYEWSAPRLHHEDGSVGDW